MLVILQYLLHKLYVFYLSLLYRGLINSINLTPLHQSISKNPHDYAIVSTLCCFAIIIITPSPHSVLDHTTSNAPLKL